MAFAIAVEVGTCHDVEKLSATSRSVGRSEEVNFHRLKNGLGSYGCVASTGRCRLGAELPGYTGMKEKTPTIEIEGPR